MSQHADTSSPEWGDETREEKLCEQRPAPKYVELDGIDGLEWHSVRSVHEGDYRADDRIETDCGHVVRWLEPEEIVLEDEETPELHGGNICYGCVRWSR